MGYVWLGGYLALSILEAIIIIKSWKASFGRVTRGEALAHIFIAFVPIAGALAAVITYSDGRLSNRWSRFWNKDFM